MVGVGESCVPSSAQLPPTPTLIITMAQLSPLATIIIIGVEKSLAVPYLFSTTSSNIYQNNNRGPISPNPFPYPCLNLSCHRINSDHPQPKQQFYNCTSSWQIEMFGDLGIIFRYSINHQIKLDLLTIEMFGMAFCYILKRKSSFQTRYCIDKKKIYRWYFILIRCWVGMIQYYY